MCPSVNSDASAPLRIVVIGAGNVASHLAPAIESSGVGAVVQVYSRKLQSARELTRKLQNAQAIDSEVAICDDAEVYLLSLVDDAIGPLVSRMPKRGNALWLHTSGSVGMEVLAPMSERYGVFYPLQTFSKGVEVDVSKVPLFIEGCTSGVEEEIRRFATPVFSHIYHADSHTRRMMHISAVFACNFTNYLWTIASELLKKEDLPFEVLHPLLEETLKKAFAVSPEKGQTGPAVRGDLAIVNKHLSVLDGQSKEIYSLLSEAIISHHHSFGK